MSKLHKPGGDWESVYRLKQPFLGYRAGTNVAIGHIEDGKYSRYFARIKGVGLPVYEAELWVRLCLRDKEMFEPTPSKESK